uniref:Putative transcriptional regulator n=1 Tax=termite gut metagenome TaxID=433724 RepID=S0DDD8_9ZZZZ
MLRLIIADDEKLIRDGLQQLPWSSIGIQLVGNVENGLEALRVIESQKPHILLTDIKMPGMDGFRLLELARKINPGIKGIILTGYSDFSYAQRAIALPVLDYILKPCDSGEVLRTVQQAAKLVLEDQRFQEDHTAHLQLQAEDQLRAVLLGHSDALQHEGIFEMNMAERYFVVLLADCSTGALPAEEAAAGLQATLAAGGPAAPWLLPLDSASFALVCHGPEEAAPRAEAAAFCGAPLAPLAAGGLRVGMSCCVRGPGQLHTAYIQAQKALSMLFSKPRRVFYTYAECAGSAGASSPGG